MVYDVLGVFKKLYEEKKDDLILGSYNLKDGLYVRIKKDKTLELFESKTVKKEKIFTNLDGIQNSEIFDWFKKVDYYSSYLNSNKALFDKKIHNINYLSYFFKIENSEYVKDKIDEHFNILLDFAKFKDKKDKEVLNILQERLTDKYRKEDILKKCKILKNSFDKIILSAKEKGIKNYVKIFFEEDINIYKKESEIYLSLKIFNDSKYNEKIDDTIYGLSNANMGLNSKKPFLESKTKKLNIPFMIKNEDALILKKFFDWLKLQPYNQDRTLDEHFFLQKHLNNDEAEITDFDYIPIKKDDINKNFKTLTVKNYLNIKNKDGSSVENYDIKKLEQLEKKVDELFYNGQLVFNYYRDNNDIKVSSFLSKELQTILFITKYSMMNYFKKYDESSFYNNIQKYGTAFILNYLRQGWEKKAKEALNLKFAIAEHNKKEKIVNIDTILEVLNKRLDEKGNYTPLNNEEFLFLAGQWAYYLLWYSKAGDRSFSLVEKYFRVKNLNALKTALQNDLSKYSHAINREAKRVKKTLALISAFNTLEKITVSDFDIFLAGFSADNIIFTKKKEENK